LQRSRLISATSLARLLVALLAVAAIGFVDYLTGSGISLDLLYLAPVVFVAADAGRASGWVVALAAAAAGLIADANDPRVAPAASLTYWNTLMRFGICIVAANLASEVRTLRRKNRELVRQDPLTGLRNARFLRDVAEREVLRSRRHLEPLTLAYIDLDNLRTVNEKLQRGAGDALLKEVAQTIQASLRSTDILARVGSDEFVILLPEAGHEAARKVCEKLRKSVQDSMARNGWPVTLSIGVVTFRRPVQSVDEMVKKAEVLMYSVKAAGKDSISYEAVD
jgi:diguanylate cyclase (GGDEF)-like protein